MRIAVHVGKSLTILIRILFRNDDIRPGNEGFEGNISRRDMKRKFYELGDNKVEKLIIVG